MTEDWNLYNKLYFEDKLLVKDTLKVLHNFKDEQ